MVKRGFGGFAAGVAFVMLAVMPWVAAVGGESAKPQASAASRRVRVAIYSGKGVTPGDAERVKSCLQSAKGFDVTLVDAKAILDGSLEKFDVLIHPGGSASGQAKALGDDGRMRVRGFVEGGGGFIGICAGAYLASAEYPWALKLLDARVVDDEHWARGVGKVTLRLAPACREALTMKEELTETHYENGPLLDPAGSKEIPDFESLATFETEIRENDAPKGIMKGTTAIARGEYGKGRVVCFSTHPERTRGHETMVAELVRWAGRAQMEGD